MNVMLNNFRLKKKGKQVTKQGKGPRENTAGPVVQDGSENTGYETVREDYMEPTPVYSEIDETAQTGQENTNTVTPDVNNSPHEYMELDATPAELAEWRQQVETANTGPYQDLVKDNGITGGERSQQYYNMPDTKQGEGSYLNVPLHSE